MVVFAKDGKAVVSEGVKPAETPEVKVEITSPEPPRTSEPTYTESQLKERETKVRSDALADLGRVRAEAERSSKIAQDALARLQAMQEERQKAELEAAQDDPAELKRIKAEQEAARLKTELANRESELNQHKEKISAYEKTLSEQTRLSTVQEVAKRLNVDAEKLTKLAKFTDGSQAVIEELAAELPKVAVKVPLKPDSNRSIGGNITDEAIIAAFNTNPYDFGNRQRYMELRQRRGK